MTINLHANVAAPLGVKHREQLDNNKTIQKEAGVRQTDAKNTPIDDDASRKREQTVEQEASSTIQYSRVQDEPFASQIEWAYQQANFIGAALRGTDSSFSQTIGVNPQDAADRGSGFTALYPDGFATYSGKLAQYIYQHVGGVFEPRIVNGAQLVGIDELV